MYRYVRGLPLQHSTDITPLTLGGCALLPTSRPTHTSMSSGVIIVPPVMKVFRSPRARRSPDARAAPTLRRDLRHAPLKRPCSRPGSYQRSSGVPVPGDNTPRIIDDRAGKSYRNRRPGPDHRGLPNMVMGRKPHSERDRIVTTFILTSRITGLICSATGRPVISALHLDGLPHGLPLGVACWGCFERPPDALLRSISESGVCT